jgi:hypothetical protein
MSANKAANTSHGKKNTLPVSLRTPPARSFSSIPKLVTSNSKKGL